ncbi:gpt [Symbiodinium sp. CCMP2592]|nr:gpt [Symbiodinium sp. CCMP2592]
MDFGDALAEGSSHRSEDSSTSTRELHSQHIHDLQLEVNSLRLQVQALRSDLQNLQTLEESLARAWVNQTGHHQRLSWIERLIQDLRNACRAFLEPREHLGGPAGSSGAAASQDQTASFLQSPDTFFSKLAKAEEDFPALDARAVLIRNFSWNETLKDNRASVILLPWERGPFAWVFGHPSKRPRIPMPYDHEPVRQSGAPSAVPALKQVPDFAKKRLQIVAMMKTSDSARWEALRKFRVLVMLEPGVTELGCILLAEASLLKEDQQIARTFGDVFSGKATSTLVKRASALWSFAKWTLDSGYGNPFTAGERILYLYLQELEANARPTSGSSFLQAWNFAAGTLQFKDQAALRAVSSRVKGLALKMYQGKRRLQQAIPLTVKQVKALEYVVIHAPYCHWKVIAGHLLFCLGASARFGDSLWLGSLNVSSHQGLCLVEAESSHWKTAPVASRKSQLLPMCSLGKFFADSNWADLWMKAREDSSLGLHPALPAWSESANCWLDRPMSTGEACCYLKEFLTAAGQKIDGIGTHSLKCTVLSWAAKSTTVPLSDRRLLGHHVDPAVMSPLTYARDELTRLMKVVHDLIVLIRKGALKPDESRVWRLAQLIKNSDGSEALLERKEASGLTLGRTMTAAELDAAKDCKMHVHSRGEVVELQLYLYLYRVAVDQLKLGCCFRWDVDLRMGAMNSTLDSAAAFHARALEIGLTAEFLKLLEDGGVTTMGTLAFISPFQVGHSDEKPLIDALKTVVKRDLTQKELFVTRRLWYEASTTAMGELKQKVERNDSAEPIRLAVAERTTRIEEQRKRLNGVHFSSDSEPSYRVTDLVFQQGTDQQLIWLPWEKYTSRAQEIVSSKSDLSISFDNGGNLRLNKKFQDAQCSLTGELQVRQALQRRSLCYDLAQLCSYSVMEAYHEEMFSLLSRPPVPGRMCITMGQVKEADKVLFLKIAEETRGALSVRPDGSKPMELQLLALKAHPQVQFCVIPGRRLIAFDLTALASDAASRVRGILCEFVNAEAHPEFMYSTIAIFEELPVGRHREARFAAIHLTSCEHDVCQWSGHRTVLVAFSTRGVGDLPAKERSFLCSLGFRLPVPGFTNMHLQSDFDWEPDPDAAQSAAAAAQQVPSIVGILPPPPQLPLPSPSPRNPSEPSVSPAPCDAQSLDASTAGATPAFPPAPPASAASRGQPTPLFVEVFAGCARLSSTFAAAGFQVLAVDGPRNKHSPLHQVWTLDLTIRHCQDALVKRLLCSPVFLVHIALPCGTGSRARERALPAHLLAAGAPQPQPLRSSQHVLGLPDLCPSDQARVTSANLLSEFTIRLLALCHERGWHVSIENPVRSWMWSVLAHFTRQLKSPALASFFNDLHTVDYAQCMLGGARDKVSRLLTSMQALCPLACECDKKHAHLPFAVARAAGRWTFATASEAEYPPQLCDAFCRLASNSLPSCPTPLPRPTVRQSRRAPQLIPEFKEFRDSRPTQGEFRELVRDGGSDGSCSTFGIFHTKQEFTHKALKLDHPFDDAAAIDDSTRRNIFDLLTKGLSSVAQKRINAIKKVNQMAKELSVEEARFQTSLPQHAQEVLKGKRILLWRKLLQETGFPDVSVSELMEGVDLVGKPTKSPLFEWKEVPATSSVQDLLDSSVWRNHALQKSPDVGDSGDLTSKLWECTMQEVDKGFLKGPFQSEEQVRAALGEEAVCCTRRFLVVQGSAENPKFRPIDDFRESGINAAFHSLDRLRLHDVDFFITLCRFICTAVDEKGVVVVFLRNGEQLRGKLSPDFGRDCAWVGRCLDLEKAYKQVPLASQSLRLAVLLVREPLTNAFRFFVSNSLPFGACAAVYSFNRISRSLLHLATTLCGVIGGVFYDDFPLIEPALTARLCSVSIEALLDTLGWRYSRDSDKDKPFASQFNLLGVQLSLDSLHLGSIALENKPSRVAKLLLVAQQMCASGELSRAEAMSLQGQLNFMVGFASGRSLKLVCRALSNLVYSNRAWTRDEIRQLGGYLECCLEALVPKSMCLKGGSRPLVIFTDAAYEQGVATWGLVVLDPDSGRREVAGGQIPSSLIDLWHQDTEDQIIAQAEAFAMVIARDYAATFAKGRRAFFFVDNESARYCMIRGSSPVRALLALAHAFYASECRDQLITWIERVPSASNVADLPSRGECAAAARMVGGRVINIDSIVKIAAQRCSDTSALPWSLLACHFKGPVPAFHFS